ncbi:hypothetical protein [Rhizobium altiplani]|nr:hypothetical protein [Rhizobium altiplani]
MTGNAVISDAEVPPELIRQYRENYDPQYLDTIRDLQLSGRSAGLSQFWTHPVQRSIPIRTSAGLIVDGKINWQSAFVRVGDAEEHIRENRATKLSDTKPTTTTDGTVRIASPELLPENGLLPHLNCSRRINLGSYDEEGR